MFESFRNFVAEFVEGERHPNQFADNDYRLAAVALRVHAAAIDGEVSPIRTRLATCSGPCLSHRTPKPASG